MKALFILSLVIFSALPGCALVPTPAPLPVRELIIPYEKLRIGVLEFSSPNNEKDYGKIFPAMIVKALRKTNRFAIHEVAGFSGKIEEAGKDYLDMYISGTVRSGGSEPCAEVRLVNAQEHEVIATFSPCGLTEVEAAVASIAKLFLKEKDIDDDDDDSVKKRGAIKLGTVIRIDGKIVVINVGRNNLIKRGMVASVHAKGEYIDSNDTYTRKRIQEYVGRTIPTPKYLGNDVIGSVYIVSVEADHSLGIFYGGDYAVPGDEVDFK